MSFQDCGCDIEASVMAEAIAHEVATIFARVEQDVRGPRPVNAFAALLVLHSCTAAPALMCTFWRALVLLMWLAMPVVAAYNSCHVGAACIAGVCKITIRAGLSSSVHRDQRWRRVCVAHWPLLRHAVHRPPVRHRALPWLLSCRCRERSCLAAACAGRAHWAASRIDKCTRSALTNMGMSIDWHSACAWLSECMLQSLLVKQML